MCADPYQASGVLLTGSRFLLEQKLYRLGSADSDKYDALLPRGKMPMVRLWILHVSVLAYRHVGEHGLLMFGRPPRQSFH